MKRINDNYTITIPFASKLQLNKSIMPPISSKPLSQAVKAFNRASIAERSKLAELERQAIVDRFPILSWPEMPIERYALGQAKSDETFCRWMEFKSMNVAGMRGGSSMKHLLFKRKNKPGWYFDRTHRTVDNAWAAIRSGFVKAFESASKGNWDEIDQIDAIYAAPALRSKAMYVYFPDELLPVCSTSHIKYFLARIGNKTDIDAKGVVGLNRVLRMQLALVPEFKGWSTWEMMAFLYAWSDPRESRRIVKIAPGEQAKYWDDCRKNGYVCVGWDSIGDLSEYESREQLRDAMIAKFDYTQAKATTKSKELWTLRELEPGDIIVANKGISEVLAIGEVLDGGYLYRDEREEFKHTVAVRWETKFATKIPEQKGWAFVTVGKIPLTVFDNIVSGKKEQLHPVVEPIFLEIERALKDRKQVILYGPPGTGKSFHSRRMALWWILRDSGVAEEELSRILDDDKEFLKNENLLSRTRMSNRVWVVIANPQIWSWEQLQKERTIFFKHGKLQRNFPHLQVGDLVIGYESGSTKRINALARVSKDFKESTDKAKAFELEFVCNITDGLTYHELENDQVLCKSEPIRFRNQGTLFALTERESEHIISLLTERDPSIEKHLDWDEYEVGQLTRVTFHPSYNYEDFIEGFRPLATNDGAGLQLRLEDGIFKKVCRQAQLNPNQKYVVLIDEINRANIAKVFGELITLIENDKRGISVTLAQSKESFQVPDNVYIIGTMNTADKSIRLLDAAFRRRFGFIELMPEPDLLAGSPVDRVALDDLLIELNRRISSRFDREKQIGHSFFMVGTKPLNDIDLLAQRFRLEVLPILQDYFFDDWAGLAEVLGTNIVDVDNYRIKPEVINDPIALQEALSLIAGSNSEADES